MLIRLHVARCVLFAFFHRCRLLNLSLSLSRPLCLPLCRMWHPLNNGKLVVVRTEYTKNCTFTKTNDDDLNGILSIGVLSIIFTVRNIIESDLRLFKHLLY